MRMSSSEPRILLVEGKRAGSDSLIHFLSQKWQHVYIVHSGTEAVTAAKFHRPQVLIFDASTMRTSGVRMCKRLIQEFPQIPVLHCRGKGVKLDHSLKVDIDLEKPFSQVKLNNRVLKLLPADDDDSKIVHLGEYKLYTGKGAIEVPGKGEQPLTPKLIRLLELFMRRPNTVVSRKELMEEVWETTYIGDTRTLDVHIRWIRQAIEEEPAKPKVLTTVHGVGYILNIEPTPEQKVKLSQNGSGPEHQI